MNDHTDGRLDALENAAREIANYAAVENSKISAKYADVVVRGHLHTVRECLAQLDMKSSAEFLQDAKDAIRESALSSLYGASRVLPVIMVSPLNTSGKIVLMPRPPPIGQRVWTPALIPMISALSPH